MGSFSLWHWLVVIALVMLLFGRGRISGTMGEIGKGLKSFKDGLSDQEDDRLRRYSEQRSSETLQGTSRTAGPDEASSAHAPPPRPSRDHGAGY